MDEGEIKKIKFVGKRAFITTNITVNSFDVGNVIGKIDFTRTEEEEPMGRICRNVRKAIDRAEKLENADNPEKVPGIVNTWEETRGNGIGGKDVGFTSTTRVGWGKG